MLLPVAFGRNFFRPLRGSGGAGGTIPPRLAPWATILRPLRGLAGYTQFGQSDRLPQETFSDRQVRQTPQKTFCDRQGRAMTFRRNSIF